MLTKISNKINLIPQILILSFPILIILGSFALNVFSIFFSLYAIFNFKKFNILDKKIIILFFSFIILIFPFESIEFKNSFFKYLSFFRFVLMLFGLIIFFENQNNKNNFFLKIYKIYTLILAIIIVDIVVEYLFGTNILGYSSYLDGRIASFTNDELIIGYIFCFVSLFTLIYIFKNTNVYYFFIIISIFLFISFIIGERSNFLKLLSLVVLFAFINYFYLEKFKIKNLFILIPVILFFSVSFYHLTKDTLQGKKLYRLLEINMPEESKTSFDIKEKYFESSHAPHYLTAYKIFLNQPIFGIGVNNFYLESQKNKYEDERLKFGGGARGSTHPHQLYLEIIAEVGLVGLIYFIFIFFYPIYLSLKSLIKIHELNIIPHLFLHLYFIFPILPSGSIFGTNTSIPFWFNLAILIYLSKKNLKIYG
jgi:O-antigen ligase